MRYQKLLRGICSLAAIFLISACSGGSGGSSNTPSASVTVGQGVAIDPYIVGAIFQEVASDGVTVLQRQSTPSDANGIFTFPAAFTVSSTVEMKVANKGLHGGAPFQGMLRRNIKAGDGQNVTITPLTTLLANGLQPTDAILALNNAGFIGFTTANLYTDPMNGLAALTSGVSDQQLRLLQAAMAVEAYMEITGNFRPTFTDITKTSNAQILNSMGAALRTSLSAAEFTRVSTSLAADPLMTGPLAIGDLIMAVVQQQQTLISLVKSDMTANGVFNPAVVTQNVSNATTQIAAMAKSQFMARMAQAALIDGIALYDTYCFECHDSLASTTKPSRTAAQIQAAITGDIGSMGILSTLTSNEILAIANALGSVTPPPSTSTDGPTLYADNCAGCHGVLANTTKKGRTAADIQNAITNNLGNMGYLTSLTSTQIQAIANALPGAPPSPPGTPPDGVALYNSECFGCHGPLPTTAKPGRTAAQIQAAITNNVGNMGYLSRLTAAEIQAIAGVLPAAPPPPTTPPSGSTLYTDNCAVCHGALATTTKPGRTAAQIQAAITNNVGNMGYLSTLTATDLQAIAGALPAAPPGGPDYSNCTACHGQPPSGNSYPNMAGRHAVHTALPSINNSCAACHAGAAHNGTVDLGVTSSFNAKSGTATVNSNMTCANVSCHGGQTTPVWQTGSIAVDTQCTSCHASGTTQYNSYASGRHSLHISRGYACTVCHNPTKLATGHFSNLTTSTFEQDPAATIGGGSTSIGNYAPSATRATSGTCSSIVCHGSQSW